MVNVRRADFLTNDYHGVVGVEYYLAAISIISNAVTSPKFFFFSDDPEWCHDNFGGYGYTIVDHSYAGDSFTTYLHLMLNCKHFIIPNSTFAWWSAYLGAVKESVVVRPNFFLKGNSESHVHLYYGLDWIEVDA
jgi:hypothetical protein